MRRAGERGFTLIELLVGLVLLSLISVGVYESLISSVRTWEAASARSDDVARMRSVEAFVRRHLSQAAFLVTGRGARASVAFSGDAHSVTFVSELPAYLGGGGLYDFSLAFERHGDDEQLVVRFSPARLSEDEEAAEPDTTVLLEQVADGKLEYYGTPRGRASPAWQDDWDDAERLPVLVAVQWTTPGTGVWPKIVVEPRADAISARLGAGAVAGQPQQGDEEPAGDDPAAPAPEAGAGDDAAPKEVRE